MDERGLFPSEIIDVLVSSFCFFDLVVTLRINHAWNAQSQNRLKKISLEVLNLKEQWEDKINSYKKEVNVLNESILSHYEDVDVSIFNQIQTKAKEKFDGIFEQLLSQDILFGLTQIYNIVIYLSNPVSKYTHPQPDLDDFKKCLANLNKALIYAKDLSGGGNIHV